MTKSERSVEDSQASMGVGCTRVVERVLATTGKFSGAPAVFKPALDVPKGGVLWALPALIANGLLRHTHHHFALPKGFYGTTHIFLLLAFMALSRIKSNEQLRYNSAGESGILLGLDRIPEVRTLRRKLDHLSSFGEVEEWSSTLSKEWMNTDLEAIGTLYIDGHVRVYHGKEKLLKRYVSRQKLCMRGISDYWVNDKYGSPFFVVSTPFNSGLINMLRDEIVPRLLKDVPHQPSLAELQENPLLMRFMLVFDREGYSPGFFKEMWEKHRIACMTYNKYPKYDWTLNEFHDQTGYSINGEEVKMKIAERGTLVGQSDQQIWVREIRKLTDSGHQTSIICTEFLSEVHVLALQMFSRWCQENFFKYMIEHFGLDALAGNKTDCADETKPIINPEYRKLESQIKSKAGKLGRQLRKFAEIILSDTPDSKEKEIYIERKSKLIEEIDLLKNDLSRLKATKKQTLRHITLNDLPEKLQFSLIAPKKKAFVDTIKMIAYRSETAMASVLNKAMSRPDDARALLREIYTQEADIVPDEKAGTLTIRLHHLTNRMSDNSAKELAKNLNETETIYPGTNLQLRYELVSG